MVTRTKTLLCGAGRERGFTLVELLIVILIVGILAAVAVPLYLGYTKDARSAEGKALAGSVLTALQGCVQAKGAGQSCAVTDITGRVGIDGSTRLTGDGRWEVTSGTSLSVSSGTGAPTFGGLVGVIGKSGKDTADIGIGMIISSTGVVLRCNLTSATAPTSTTEGEAC